MGKLIEYFIASVFVTTYYTGLVSSESCWEECNAMSSMFYDTTPFTFRLQNQATGTCLQVQGGSVDDNAALELAACDNVPAQTMTIYGRGSYIMLPKANNTDYPNKCITVYRGSIAAGILVNQYTCVAAHNQRWVMFMYFNNDPTVVGIMWQYQHYCISQGNDDAGQVQIMTELCDQSTNQKWNLL